MNETWEQETLRLLNEGEHSEALKKFREKHGMVNRWVCNHCGLISPHYSSKGCDKCGSHNVEVRVVIEMPNAPAEARCKASPPAGCSTCRRCGGTAKHKQHSGGHDVICNGCGARGVIDHETESDAWMAWIKFNQEGGKV